MYGKGYIMRMFITILFIIMKSKNTINAQKEENECQF